MYTNFYYQVQLIESHNGLVCSTRTLLHLKCKNSSILHLFMIYRQMYQIKNTRKVHIQIARVAFKSNTCYRFLFEPLTCRHVFKRPLVLLLKYTHWKNN